MNLKFNPALAEGSVIVVFAAQAPIKKTLPESCFVYVILSVIDSQCAPTPKAALPPAYAITYLLLSADC